jgi:hypothetical protein
MHSFDRLLFASRIRLFTVLTEAAAAAAAAVPLDMSISKQLHWPQSVSIVRTALYVNVNQLRSFKNLLHDQKPTSSFSSVRFNASMFFIFLVIFGLSIGHDRADRKGGF